MVKISYDLHIHSCLSPCGHEDMTPANIVLMAKLKELDVIALTDHNSCKNCEAFLYHTEKAGILGIPGMELCTREEVHVLCLFSTVRDAMEFDGYVSSCLIPFPNNEKIFGIQSIMDREERIVGTVDNLLINATTISFDEVYGLMKEFSGIMIPAHIDKSSNSVISNLGFIPPDSKFHTIELSTNYNKNLLVCEDGYVKKCNRIYNSDAHELGAISEAVHFLHVNSGEIKDILLALA